MGIGMNFMGMGWRWGCRFCSQWGWVVLGLKLMGIGWERVNFCEDGVGMGLMSIAVSLCRGYNYDSPTTWLLIIKVTVT